MNQRNWFFAALLTTCFAGLCLVENSHATQIQPPPAKQNKPEEPGDKELAALMKEFNSARDKVVKELVDPAPALEKMNVWLANNPLNSMADKFFAINKQFPKNQAGLSAVTLLISQGSGELKDKAIEILISEYANDDRIIKNMNAITTGLPSKNTEKWLRQLVEKTENKRVQGTALFAHIDYIRSVRQVREFAKRKPDFAAQAGEAVNAYLKNYDFEQAQEERYAILTKLSKEFAGVPSGIVNQTFKQRADKLLYITDKLSVGKMAMDIEGEDLDGKPMELKEFRDKVVLLFFWGDWAPPAQRMYSHLRSIEKKLKGKPFEIVGFNSDDERDFAKAMVKYQQFGWRNFWLGGKQGPITKDWKVTSWPTTYLLDGTGKIRFKQIQKEDLDNGITALMAEIGHEVDLSDHSDGEIKLVGAPPKPKKPSQQPQLQMRNPGGPQIARRPGAPGQRPQQRPRAPRFLGPVISGVLPDLDGDGKPGISKSK